MRGGTREGPITTISICRSCVGCRYIEVYPDRYGMDNYCRHDEARIRADVGRVWRIEKTPDWCPLLSSQLELTWPIKGDD